MNKPITENTKISVGLLIVFVGGIMWLSSVNWKADASVKGNEELKVENAQLRRDISDIKSDVSAIKQSVKNIEERL